MRPIWTGAISFGLIHIPIKLYKATTERRLDFDMLHKDDMVPVKFKRVCESNGEEVPYPDIVKGYEYKKGEYVVVDKADFQKASPKKSQVIQISNFVSERDVNSIYFSEPYYLAPDKGAAKVYALLKEALKKSKKAGIGRFVLRTKEYLVMIKPENGIMALNTLRFPSEIKDMKKLEIPKEEVSQEEVNMAIQLVEQLSGKFEPEKFQDTYTEELKKIIEAKAKGKTVKVSAYKPEETHVEDLMAKLKESLKYTKENKEEGRYVYASS
jgi:DNA end-binding protein Ku